jgi:WD40 repeat protein
MQAFQLTKEAVWYGEVRFSPNGRWLALNGKPFGLLDPTSGSVTELPLSDYRAGFAFTRSGSAIAYLPGRKVLREHDLATGREREWAVRDGHPLSVAASPGGETLYMSVSGPSYGESASIRVLGAEGMEGRATFGTVADDLRALRVSADGRWIGATSYHRVRAWHLDGEKWPSRASVCATPKAGASNFALSANGARLAIVTSRGLEVWDTATGKRAVDSGKHRRRVTAVACSPMKPLIATADNAGNVFLWDHAGNVLTRYAWGLGEVRSLAFAPDGLRCAAAGSGKVVIWDVDA